MKIEFAEILMHPATILTFIFGLDLLFGDPVYRLHPVRLIGKLLTCYENRLRKIGLDGKFGGILLVLLLLASSLVIAGSVFYLLESLHWSLGWLWSVYLGWSFLALADLLQHAKHVATAIKEVDLAEAKRQVGMLVGRDTKQMDLAACGRAAVESVSENLNDGVIAPLFYFCFFGIPGMLFFKVVSTLDSMVGYRNERYQDFGWCGARFDDLLSWIPARLSWLLLSVSAATRIVRQKRIQSRLAGLCKTAQSKCRLERSYSSWSVENKTLRTGLARRETGSRLLAWQS